jgi:peroxiredoxin
MKGRSYLLSLVLSLIASAVIASAAISGQPSGPADPPEGKPIAPAFTLTSVDGEKFDSSALRGKVVVLNFWFTGCEPCVAEFSKLNALVNKFKSKDVVFIAPTLDNEATLKPFLRGHRFKYHVVPNAGSLIVSTYSDGSGNVVFPTHIVIDREGKIDTRLTGAKAVGDLQKAIARLTDAETEKAK